MTKGLQEPNLYFPWEQLLSICYVNVHADFREHNYHE